MTGNIVEDLTEGELCRRLLGLFRFETLRDLYFWRFVAAFARGGEGDSFQKIGKLIRIGREAGKPIPFRTLRDRHVFLELRHLLGAHQAGVVILMTLERHTEALDRVGNETLRLIFLIGGIEGLQDRFHVVARKVCHQRVQTIVVVVVEQCLQSRRSAEITLQVVTPGRSAFEGQRGIKVVRAFVDPAHQRFACRTLEGGFQFLAVFERDDVPVHRPKKILDFGEQKLVDDTIQTLSVVIDDPPEVSNLLLPTFQQRLEDIAFVQFSVAHEGDHTALANAICHSAVGLRVILDQGCEKCGRNTESNRTGRKIDVVGVFGARGIGLYTAQCPKILHLLLRLPT